jgi:hypothetical protein
MYLLGGVYVREISQAAGENHFLTLGMALVPILAVAWFLRLMVRVAIQNLAQLDDARQREAATATYLSLLADQTHAITPEERALALSALFRPASGAGEDVAPPSFLDLIRNKAE